MRALTWQGNEHVEVTDVPDPTIQEPNDIIIRVTSTAICGSDLHLYGVLGPYLKPGDVLGHEPMGIVEETGPDITHLRAGDRVVIPFNISCGHCWMCQRGLFAQCETTQVRSQGKGAALFGYTSLYGSVPGGQAQYLRVPQAQFGPIKVPEGPPDEQYLYLSDILPTAYQAVAYADVPDGGTLAVLGLGPVGQMSRADRPSPRRGTGDRRGSRVRTAGGGRPVRRRDPRPGGARRHREHADRTDGRARPGRRHRRGRDGGTRSRRAPQHQSGRGRAEGHRSAPGLDGAKVTDRAALDRLDALHTAVKAVRRGGTVSISGVYGGEIDPMPMMEMFDRGVQLRMGQAHVRRWINDLLPIVSDDRDPLGVRQFATHHLPLEDAPHGYEIFRDKAEGCIKVVLQP